MSWRIKYIFSFLGVFFFFLVPVYALYAQTGPYIENPLNNINTLEDFIVAVLKIVRNIAFLGSVFFIVYGGFMLVTAKGEEKKITDGRNALLWAVVGTGVLLGAELFANALNSSIKEIEAVVAFLSQFPHYM